MKWVLPLLVGVYLALSLNSLSNGGDFDVFLDAAKKLHAGHDIYAPPLLNNLQYLYSPLFALVLIPFSGSFFWTELVWLILSGCMFYRVFILAEKYFNIDALTKWKRMLWVLIPLVLVGRFVLYNIAMIQMTMFLMWSMLEAVYLCRNGKQVTAALLIAIAVNIKLMPLVIVPYFFFRGAFKVVYWFAFFSFGLLWIPSVFIGHEFNTQLLGHWWTVINPSNPEHLVEAWRNAQSLSGTIPVFLIKTTGELPDPRNIMNLPLPVVHLIVNSARLCCVMGALAFLRKPFREEKCMLHEWWAVSYILLITPMIFPHQQKYAFLFSYPMMIYIVYYLLADSTQYGYVPKSFMLLLLIPVFVIYSPIVGADVIGRRAYDLIHHYRLLGISTLLLSIISAFLRPIHIQRTATLHPEL